MSTRTTISIMHFDTATIIPDIIRIISDAMRMRKLFELCMEVKHYASASYIGDAHAHLHGYLRRQASLHRF